MKPADLADKLIDFENGDLTYEQTVELFQYLVDTGLAWTLQGMYGRTAQGFLDAGIITRKEKGGLGLFQIVLVLYVIGLFVFCSWIASLK